MSTDINERVLAAFQIEYQEQLEGIRALLADLEQRGAPGDGRLEEAFRLAHSMKGGARVCDLRPIEVLAHRVETLLSRVRQGTLPLSRDVGRVIALVLDSIEDWMTALAAQQPTPEPDEAMAAIDRILETGTSDPEGVEVPAEPPDIAQRLRAAFQGEYAQYVQGIRQFLVRLDGENDSLSREAFEDAFRMAHSLKQAARLAEVAAVEQLGHQLETLFSRVRTQDLEIDAEVSQVIHRALDSIETEMGRASGPCPQSVVSSGASKPDEAASQQLAPVALDSRSHETPAESSINVVASDTVRVSVDSLDRLLRSSGQLLAESLRQDQFAMQLHDLTRSIDELQRERQSLQKGAANDLRRLSRLPKFDRVMRYLDSVERQARTLSRDVRHVQTIQQRSSWLLRSLGEQVQGDVLRARMVPAEGIFQGFRKLVRDLARDEGKEVDFLVIGLDVQADRRVLQTLKDPLMHALRNAVIHGVERPAERASRGKPPQGRVAMKIELLGNRLQVTVQDDGSGLDLERVSEMAVRHGMLTSSEAEQRSPEALSRLVFQAGFSTSRSVTELSGRGMGLSVLHEAVTRLQGEVQLATAAGAGTSLVASVPLSISTHRLLLVCCEKQAYAIPVHGIQRLLRVKLNSISTVEGRPVVSYGGELLPLVSFTHLMGLEDVEFQVSGDALPTVVLALGDTRIAAGVDAFLSERNYLIHDLTGPAAAQAKFSGAILLDDGTPALVVNLAELLRDWRPLEKAPARKVVAGEKNRVPTVLIVDDSFTTRTLEKSILETHGYSVRVATDGLEALAVLRSNRVDLVISDIQMPRMDGFELLQEMKQDASLVALPVILVTSMDRREDQERGLSLGADAYIVKRKFDHQDLLATIRQIL